MDDSADEWGSAVAKSNSTKLAKLVLIWSGSRPERALSVLRSCVSLMDNKVALAAPASSSLSSPQTAPDEWGSAVARCDATKLAQLVLVWSGSKPEPALSILRHSVSLLKEEVAFSAPASSLLPSPPTTYGPASSSCLNAIIVALNETCDGTSWYTSTKQLQLASLEFCIACRTHQTLRLEVDAKTPRRLLAAADAPPPHPKRLCGTRVPRLRARRVTWKMPTAAELGDPILAMMDVDYLRFGYDFDGSLDGVAWPQRLKTIKFHYRSRFNQPLELVKWPPCLEKITLGQHFNQPLELVKWPPCLEKITLGQHFNQPLELVKWPPCLEKITLGEHFNQPLELVKWPACLEKITLGQHFNQPIEGAKFPASLQELIFPGSFLGPIAGVVLPNSLQKLDLGMYFNQPIESVAWPPSLKQLELGIYFNQPIEQAKLPASMQELTFGNAFDQPIERVSWPDSLQRLFLGFSFNQRIDNVRWPASLQDITFGCYDDQGDNKIVVYADFNQNIGTSVWPASLRR
ncbi:unnamed protein product, partial [Ectocarpus fasciculatus]